MKNFKFKGWDKENQREFKVVQITFDDDGVFAWREPYETERVGWCTAGFKVGEECDLYQLTGTKNIYEKVNL